MDSFLRSIIYGLAKDFAQRVERRIDLRNRIAAVNENRTVPCGYVP